MSGIQSLIFNNLLLFLISILCASASVLVPAAAKATLADQGLYFSSTQYHLGKPGSPEETSQSALMDRLLSDAMVDAA